MAILAARTVTLPTHDAADHKGDQPMDQAMHKGDQPMQAMQPMQVFAVDTSRLGTHPNRATLSSMEGVSKLQNRATHPSHSPSIHPILGFQLQIGTSIRPILSVQLQIGIEIPILGRKINSRTLGFLPRL